jgi:hypothetical protein
MANKLSSTNIAELVQAHIDVIKNVNDAIVGSGVDEAMLKNVAISTKSICDTTTNLATIMSSIKIEGPISDAKFKIAIKGMIKNIQVMANQLSTLEINYDEKSLKPISSTIKSLSEIATSMSEMKLGGIFGNIKFELALDSLVANIKKVAEKFTDFEFPDKAANSIENVNTVVTGMVDVAGGLSKLGLLAIPIVIMKPLIMKTIDIILSISKKLEENGGDATAAAKNMEAIGSALKVLGSSLLIFVLATMGGVVPLAAIISLLAVKLFVQVFFSLFGKGFDKDISQSTKSIQLMAVTLLILSGVILIWALTGILIMEAWKEILITITFVILAILVFTLLGFMNRFIGQANKSILLIAATLVILSMTVLLWALMGDLIMEEWDSILVTIAFVIAAIGVFTLLGFAIKFVQQGNKSLLMIALTLIVLSLTVLLWALMGDLIMEEWASILVTVAFVVIAIGLFTLLALASQFIQGGANEVLKMTIALVILSVAALLFCFVGEQIIQHWVAVLIVIAFIVVMIGICVALTFASPYVQTGVAVLVSLAAALLMTAVALLVFVIAVKLFTWETIAIACAVLMSLALTMAAIGLISPAVALGGAATILMGAGLAVFSVGLLIFGAALLLFDEEKVALGCSILMEFALRVAGLGLMSPLIVLGAAALAIMGGALLIFSIPLLIFAAAFVTLKSFEITEEQVTAPIGYMGALVKAVEENESLGVVAIGKAVLKMNMLTGVAAAIGVMAKILQQIASLAIPIKFDKDGNGTEFVRMTTDDFATAALNAVGIALTFGNLFADEDEVTIPFGKTEIKYKPLTQKALEGITFSAMIKMGMLTQIVSCIGSMAGTLQNIASMMIPDVSAGFDDQGNPKGYLRMKTEDFATAAINAVGIAQVFGNLFSDEEEVKVPFGDMEVKYKPLTQKALENITGSTKRKMERLAEIVACIGQMAGVLQNMSSLLIPDDEAGFDENGKPKGYIRMKSEEFIAASTNAVNIAYILANMFGENPVDVTIGGQQVKFNPISSSTLDNITGRTKRKMLKLGEIVMAVGQMADVLQKMSSLIVPDDTGGFDENGKPLAWKVMKAADFVAASENIAKITLTLLQGLTTYRGQVTGGKTVIETVDDLSKRSLEKVKIVLEAFASINGIVDAIQAMVQMNIPTAWDEAGNPTAFRTVTPEERQQAINNIIQLMTELLKAITSESMTDMLDNMGRKAKNNLETIMSSCGGVSSLVDAVKKAASFDKKGIGDGISNIKECILRYAGMMNDLFVDKWGWTRKQVKMFGISFSIPWYEIVDEAEINIGNLKSAMNKMNELTASMGPMGSLVDGIKNLADGEGLKTAMTGVEALKQVVLAYTQIFTGDENGKGGINITPTGEKKFRRFKETVWYHDKFAKINSKDLTKNTDNFVKFIDKANSVDVEKMKSVRDMFEQMARFSESVKGDFDKLANVLSEKLVDILDKLNTTLKDIQETPAPTPNSPTNPNNPTDPNAPKGPQEQKKNQEQKYLSKLSSIEDDLEDMIGLLRQINRNTDR